MTSKVETRPGFAVESVDVYETSDLPEADQYLIGQNDETTDSIETLRISANEAFGRFKGAYIDSTAVDFSDKLRNSRRKGYNVVWTGEPSKEEQETPIKKYQRLNCEVRELLEDINTAKAENDSGIADLTLENMTGQLGLMHKQLLELRLEDVLGEETIHIMTDPQAAARKKLLSQLEQLKTVGAGGSSKADAVSPSYSLYIKHSTSALDEGALLSSLSSRLAVLEATVGFSADQMSILTMETGKKSISQAVQVLSAKTTLMDPSKLDHIEGRLGALQQKLGHLQESSKSILDSDSVAKLDHMLATVERSKPLYASLPEVVVRMESLQNLHQQAAEFSRSLVELETVQSQLSVQLGNNLTLLSSTKEKFTTNLANINQNFSSLFDRIDQLKQGKK
eukprot:GFUD01014360.1.p1 GENE.GFUD01014360.1~~GFUD01014360.1.p1  ORF type:complete len:395 (-),score=120.58 GFUD01014360.1:104-1288(-)